MRALLHPTGRLESLAAAGRVLSADELVQANQAATLRGLYSVRGWRVELARPQMGRAETRVRYEATPGAFTDEAPSLPRQRTRRADMADAHLS
jgi:hypothetical protein